jgi:hypothetical protein
MIKTHRWLLAILFSVYTSSLIATCLPEDQYPNEWQDSRYTDHNNGTVTDKKTGLMWAKCVLGQDAITCKGLGNGRLTWKAALEAASNSTLAGFGDWRVPNLKELSSLTALNCYDPAINANLFPNTPHTALWSSTPYAKDSEDAFNVHFNYSQDDTASRDKKYHYVRFVRGDIGS